MNFLKRLGSQPVKISFSIEVSRVKVPQDRLFIEGDFISLSVERSEKKLSNTSEQPLVRGPSGFYVDFDSEILTLDATLYKDNNGNYQEKLATLTIYHCKKSAKKIVMNPIGSAPISLHTLVNVINQDVAVNVKLGNHDMSALLCVNSSISLGNSETADEHEKPVQPASLKRGSSLNSNNFQPLSVDNVKASDNSHLTSAQLQEMRIHTLTAEEKQKPIDSSKGVPAADKSITKASTNAINSTASVTSSVNSKPASNSAYIQKQATTPVKHQSLPMGEASIRRKSGNQSDSDTDSDNAATSLPPKITTAPPPLPPKTNAPPVPPSTQPEFSEQQKYEYMQKLEEMANSLFSVKAELEQERAKNQNLHRVEGELANSKKALKQLEAEFELQKQLIGEMHDENEKLRERSSDLEFSSGGNNNGSGAPSSDVEKLKVANTKLKHENDALLNKLAASSKELLESKMSNLELANQIENQIAVQSKLKKVITDYAMKMNNIEVYLANHSNESSKANSVNSASRQFASDSTTQYTSPPSFTRPIDSLDPDSVKPKPAKVVLNPFK